MERFPIELLYVLAIIGFVLFNILGQRAARRRQQEEQAAQPAPPAEEEPLEDIWGRTPAPAPAPVVLVAPPPQQPAYRAPPAPRRRLHPARALLKDKRDLRRAVVLMMVLGPCRAEEPPEQR